MLNSFLLIFVKLFVFGTSQLIKDYLRIRFIKNCVIQKIIFKLFHATGFFLSS